MLLDDGARIRSFWELCASSTVKIFSPPNSMLFSAPTASRAKVFSIFEIFSALELELDGVLYAGLFDLNHTSII